MIPMQPAFQLFRIFTLWEIQIASRQSFVKSLVKSTILLCYGPFHAVLCIAKRHLLIKCKHSIVLIWSYRSPFQWLHEKNMELKKLSVSWRRRLLTKSYVHRRHSLFTWTKEMFQLLTRLSDRCSIWTSYRSVSPVPRMLSKWYENKKLKLFQSFHAS